jgi:hypothetical protein
MIIINIHYYIEFVKYGGHFDKFACHHGAEITLWEVGDDFTGQGCHPQKKQQVIARNLVSQPSCGQV